MDIRTRFVDTTLHPSAESVYGQGVDESYAVVQTRQVARCLTESGHSAAARAMHRVQQIAVLPAADGRIDVWLRCGDYDFHLLSALTKSQPGSRSGALDDAYRQVFPWVTGTYRFRFVVSRADAETA